MLPEPCLSPNPTERPLHYSEKVLPILHCLGTESYLVVKKQMSMENMLIYLGEDLEGMGWDGMEMEMECDGMGMELQLGVWMGQMGTGKGRDLGLGTGM